MNLFGRSRGGSGGVEVRRSERVKRVKARSEVFHMIRHVMRLNFGLAVWERQCLVLNLNSTR